MQFKKILFIGTVVFSHQFLNKLVELDAEIVGVITKKASPFNSDFADLIPICRKHNIPYLLESHNRFTRQGNLDWIKISNPDIIFCFGWSWLLEEAVLDIAPVVGFHPAELPMNRGRHPLIWALALDLHKTASTFFFMDKGADSGDILSQAEVPIFRMDDASSLYWRVTDTALKQIEDFLPKLENGTYSRSQQDHSLANYWRKRTASDGKIDFRMSSRSIYNLVRALSTPYVGAHVVYKGNEIKIWKVTETLYKHERAFLERNIEPGKILEVQLDSVLVKCGKNAIWLIGHEFTKLPSIGEYL